MNSKIPALALAIAALLPGCATSRIIALNPVENRDSAPKDGVYEATAVDTRPALTHSARVVYPAVLRANGVNGMAEVAFTVKADGSVADPLVLKADDVRFGDAAAAAILKWRFRPAVLNGVAVDCRVTVPVGFSAPARGFAGVDSAMGDPAEAEYGRIQPTEPR